MLNHLTQNLDYPINKNDSNSYKTLFELYPLHSIMIQHWSVGHAQFVWDVCSNPKVIDIYSRLYDILNKDLITSFDGISIHLPPEKTERRWYKKNDWLHVDQSYVNNKFDCLQSFISLLWHK